VIALKKEVFELVKKEAQYMGILFLLALIIFKIAFYKENLAVLFRNVLSLFWLFVLPGYFILLYWREKLDFMERFIVGIMISAAITSIARYYSGLIGLNLKYHAILLPLVLIIIGIAAAIRK
jgi:uncharacterized membrane protein